MAATEEESAPALQILSWTLLSSNAIRKQSIALLSLRITILRLRIVLLRLSNAILRLRNTILSLRIALLAFGIAIPALRIAISGGRIRATGHESLVFVDEFCGFPQQKSIFPVVRNSLARVARPIEIAARALPKHFRASQARTSELQTVRLSAQKDFTICPIVQKTIY